MKRTFLLVLLTLFVSASARAQMVKTRCASGINRIEVCPVKGCTRGTRAFDPKLNEQKNIRTSNKTPVDKDFDFLRDLDNPGSDYVEGGDRAPLRALGEGNMIRVVAWAVRTSKGSKETCNCQLTAMRDKDNHIVLIDPDDTTPSKADEPRSQTAEFTPRVRLDRPNLKWSKLNALIEGARRKALKVRVTGLQMFDSHHFFHGALPRNNDWEIHPVFKLEYCPRNKTCVEGSNANWVSLQP